MTKTSGWWRKHARRHRREIFQQRVSTSTAAREEEVGCERAGRRESWRRRKGDEDGGSASTTRLLRNISPLPSLLCTPLRTLASGAGRPINGIVIGSGSSQFTNPDHIRIVVVSRTLCYINPNRSSADYEKRFMSRLRRRSLKCFVSAVVTQPIQHATIQKMQLEFDGFRIWTISDLTLPISNCLLDPTEFMSTKFL